MDVGQTYFYPLLFIRPDFSDEILTASPYSLSKRKWQTSTFDLATLATSHRLHLPYQAMDLFLSHCNVELSVEKQPSRVEADQAVQAFRIGAYCTGISPFLNPFVTTHSINEYSGVNSRDSGLLRSKLPAGMEVGLTSDDATVEAWPMELSFQCTVMRESLEISSEIFIVAAQKASVWLTLSKASPKLSALAEATIAAPTLGNLSQSILHIWSALESLFPTVSSEVSFRMALYTAQLASAGSARLNYYETVRAAYNIRSQIAHGSKGDVSYEDWKQAWNILLDCINAIVGRGRLPHEKDLLCEILQ